MSASLACVCVLAACCVLARAELSAPAEPRADPALPCLLRLTLQELAPASIVYRGVHRDEARDPLPRALHASGHLALCGHWAGDGGRRGLAYLLVADDAARLARSLRRLLAVPGRPHRARFLLAAPLPREVDARPIFDAFLSARISDVLLLNRSHSLELYSYDAHSGGACGARYSGPLGLGACGATADAAGLYTSDVPQVRGCFYRVSAAHWPPFSMDPARSPDSGPGSGPGAEQQVFRYMSVAAGFRFEFRYDFDPESFSKVGGARNVQGPLRVLAENRSDVILGGLLLLPSRASAFDYVHGHLDGLDAVRVLVRRASAAPAWTDHVAALPLPVWMLLVLSIAACWAVLARALGGGRALSAALAAAVGHSARPRAASRPARLLLLLWSVCAALLAGFYSASLTSLTTRRRSEPQVADEAALAASGLQPCISGVMCEYLRTEAARGDALRCAGERAPDCEQVHDSVRVVARSHGLYTMTYDSMFALHRLDFLNEFGEDEVFPLSTPYASVVYAMYTSSGSPLAARLRPLALRARETGLTERNLRLQQFRRRVEHYYRARPLEARFACPWRLYAVGLAAALLALIVERAL